MKLWKRRTCREDGKLQAGKTLAAAGKKRRLIFPDQLRSNAAAASFPLGT